LTPTHTFVICVTRPEMIDQNHIYSIFPSDQRDQQISNRYTFDQFFPVGHGHDTNDKCGVNKQVTYVNKQVTYVNKQQTDVN
jgi:hypothetical protein